MSRWQATSAKQIVLGCTIGFSLITFLIFWSSFKLYNQPTPMQLPPPPEIPTAIVSISLPGWYEADPVVRTAEGSHYAYTYNLEAGEKSWQLDLSAETDGAAVCSAQDVAEITESAGVVIECQQGQMRGEWCPAPIALYAVAADGTVWEHIKEQPCTWIFYTLSLAAGAGGFVVGTLIALTRHLLANRRDQFLESAA